MFGRYGVWEVKRYGVWEVKRYGVWEEKRYGVCEVKRYGGEVGGLGNRGGWKAGG